MTNYSGPRPVLKQEISEMMELMDFCFRKAREKGGMQFYNPHCYRIDSLENNAVIVVDNKVVSHIGCIPQTAKIGLGEEINVRGISGVATNPQYRGKGLMKLLMQYWLDKMKKEKIPISDLGGDRQRYNHFGWENAGREWVFTVNKRSLPLSSKSEKWKIKKYEGAPDDLKIIMKEHNLEEFGVKRSEELYKMIMSRKGLERYIATNGLENSYIVVNGEEKFRNIDEFGGSAGGIKNLLIYLLEVPEVERVVIYSPYFHPHNKLFFEISAYWYLGYNRMIKIIDLPLTLKGFLGQMNRKWKKKIIGSKWLSEKESYSLTLVNRETEQRATIVFDQKTIDIQEKPCENTLVLSEFEIVRLLFSMVPLEENETGMKFLDIIFPLDFYFWHNEMV